MPVQYQKQTLPSRVSVYVDLQAGTSRGIHMSRLYQILMTHFSDRDLSQVIFSDLIAELKSSQNGLSESARLEILFDLPVRRQSLKSEMIGQRLYPVQFVIELGPQGPQAFLSWEIQYSSTCPASTALSLDLWREQAKKTNLSALDWLETLDQMPATPHAQRSVAKIQIELSATEALQFETWIEKSELVLQTPVQTLVKRVDEQEFARLNGENPMFCEDAARRIQEWLDLDSSVLSYSASFEHQESLHPHNAVAKISRIRST
jgi:GTP cyclohydrolase I